MQRSIAGLRRQSDAVIALMGAAYLERALEALIESRFRPLAADEHARIFSGRGGGSLGTFAAKIDMAYAMKLLAPIARDDLKLVNHLRNTFAHSLHKVSFSNPTIEADCKALKVREVAEAATGMLKPLAGAKDRFCWTVHTLYGGLIVALEDSRSGKFDTGPRALHDKNN